MRRLVGVAVAGVAVAASVGCTTRTCGDGPVVRQDQLSERSEDVRHVNEPLHWGRSEKDKVDENLTPVRVHGSIQ